jgi:hypothetical protein
MTNLTWQKKGIITMYLLVFAGIFLILFSGLLGFIFLQLKQSSERAAWSESLSIAEAGINYYRWCINNDVEQDCLAEKDYFDASGNLIGKFSIEVSSTVACGQNIKKDIISTGWTYKFPGVKRSVAVLYARASVAKFSYVLDSNVWIGPDHEINGPYHSNGGIRMDGPNQSTITSALEDWVCSSSFGCSPCPISNGCYLDGSDCVCPGVFTTTLNGDSGLFDFPSPPFDFDGITIDLATMKIMAISDGVYLPPSNTINLAAKGYHIKFQEDGTFEAWLITGLSSVWAYSIEEGEHYDYFIITNEYLYGNYSVPSECSAVFIEDNVWAEGTVHGRLTLASANLIESNKDTDIILPNSIDYSTTTGADALALIGERNVLIGPQSPDNMILRGIFTAQKGRFSRNCYWHNSRDELNIYGSVVSKGRVGTQWSGGSCEGSGYQNRESYFDSNLIYNPPPFVPYIDPEFKIIDWKEIK